MENLENKSTEELKSIKDQYVKTYIGDFDKPYNYQSVIERFNKLISEKSNNLALYNTKMKQVVSRNLTSDMVDFQMYKKNLIKKDYIKVIETPSEDEVEVLEDTSLVFKPNFKPKFLDINY